MPTASLNGIRIDYDVAGEGPAVLLSHGYSATGRMWAEQQRALADRYRVVSWDMRGHGATDAGDDPASYSADLTVADMRALLLHLGIERAVIGGLSLGGYVSLAFAIAHPEMVRALVIADSGPGYRKAEARADWNRRAFERAAELESNGRKELALAARGMLAQEDSRVIDGLPAIRVPTLVIVGDRDQPFLAPSQYMAAKIAGARLEVVKDAGHSSNLDQPEAFTRVLRDFLDTLR